MKIDGIPMRVGRQEIENYYNEYGFDSLIREMNMFSNYNFDPDSYLFLLDELNDEELFKFEEFLLKRM